MNYKKECENFGDDLNNCLETTRDFIGWWIDYLEREESQAVHDINLFKEALDSLPREWDEEER